MAEKAWEQEVVNHTNRHNTAMQNRQSIYNTANENLLKDFQAASDMRRQAKNSGNIQADWKDILTKYKIAYKEGGSIQKLANGNSINGNPWYSQLSANSKINPADDKKPQQPNNFSVKDLLNKLDVTDKWGIPRAMYADITNRKVTDMLKKQLQALLEIILTCQQLRYIA